MILDEAIKHAEEKAEELRERSDVLSETSTTSKGKEISDCLECAEEHEQLAEWLKELQDLRAFAKWVRGEVLDNYFEESSGAFAEIACRKLTKLGYTEVDGDVYKKKEKDE